MDRDIAVTAARDKRLGWVVWRHGKLIGTYPLFSEAMGEAGVQALIHKESITVYGDL